MNHLNVERDNFIEAIIIQHLQKSPTVSDCTNLDNFLLQTQSYSIKSVFLLYLLKSRSKVEYSKKLLTKKVFKLANKNLQ